MKIMIAYPPLPSAKGVPLLSQNRQFQWFNRPTFIYPMIPAYAATLLKDRGYEVVWADGIAREMNSDEFKALFDRENPDLVALETKTPVVKAHWKWVDELKAIKPACKVVLMGDHVTALPAESLQQCKADYVLTGGDYDWALLSLASHLSKGSALEPGVYWRDEKDQSIRNSGLFKLTRNLNENPLVDRDLTQWELYSRENGNFKFRPGTYQMAGRDCWWGKCTFCSWTTTFPNFRSVSPSRHLDEVEQLVKKYGVREIFDDSGCFPAGGWLRQFCQGMIDRGLNKKVVYGCNMKPGILKKDLWDMMGQANFRFVLFGIESASQATLQRLKKGGTVDQYEETMRLAKQAGLEPHVTCMVGYPWETFQDAKNTIDLTRGLFDKGYIDTLQATIVIPYPGTPLYAEAKKEGWLRFEDYDRFDMREPVMNILDGTTPQQIMELTRGIYTSFLTPRFILRKLAGIRTWDDVKFLFIAAIRVLGHLADFSSRQKKKDGCE
jgi:anaerobic magnesium-protoporphyrin IX monomethyl ester cyclase